MTMDLMNCDDIEAAVREALTGNGRLRRAARKEAQFKRMYGRRATGPLTPEEAYDR